MLAPVPTTVVEMRARKNAQSLTTSFLDSKKSLKRTDLTARAFSRTLISTEANKYLKKSLDKF